MTHPPWKVTGYQIDPVAKTLHITLQWPPDSFPLGPVCKEQVPHHDHRAARYWQHLTCMGYRTELICKLPRARCPTHGVHSVQTPWADPNVRQRAVQRGLVRRDGSQVTRLCIDDKSFLRGSSFVTILSALGDGAQGQPGLEAQRAVWPAILLSLRNRTALPTPWPKG